MESVHDRFEQFPDPRKTLSHNADVLQKAAQEYCDTIREEFRFQVQEPLENFQAEIEALVQAHIGEGSLVKE